MGAKTYRVLDPGDTGYVHEEPAQHPTEAELADMLFQELLHTGMAAPVLVDGKGKMFTMSVKFFVVPASKKQRKQAIKQLGLCKKHLTEKCAKCAKKVKQ